MAAHTWSGRKNINSRMPIGETYHLPNIEPLPVGDHGKLVSEGDIDIAKGIFDQLGHFRRARISRDTFAFYKPFVEGERLPCTTRRNSPDRPIVMRQFFQNFARQYPFRTIGDADVRASFCYSRHGQIGTHCGDRIAHRFGRADGRRRFENNRVTLLKNLSDLSCRRHDVTRIGRMVAVLRKRGGHRNDEHVGRRHFGRCLEQATLDNGLYQTIQIDFLDVNFAPIDRIDDALRHIDTMHRTTSTRDDRSSRQANISQPDHTNVRLHVTTHGISIPEFCRACLASGGKFNSNGYFRGTRRSMILPAECPSPKGLCARAMAE